MRLWWRRFADRFFTCFHYNGTTKDLSPSAHHGLLPTIKASFLDNRVVASNKWKNSIKERLTLEPIQDVVCVRREVKVGQIKCTYMALALEYMCATINIDVPDSKAMLLPGRVPGYKDSDVKLRTTKHAIWDPLMRHSVLEAADPLCGSDEADE